MLKLVVQDDAGKSAVVPLQGEVTIGRGEDNTICLTERNVSRHHARIVGREGRVELHDLGSYNGILVNGERIAGVVVVDDHDRIQIGNYLLAVNTRTVKATPHMLGQLRVPTADPAGGHYEDTYDLIEPVVNPARPRTDSGKFSAVEQNVNWPDTASGEVHARPAVLDGRPTDRKIKLVGPIAAVAATSSGTHPAVVTDEPPPTNGHSANGTRHGVARAGREGAPLAIGVEAHPVDEPALMLDGRAVAMTAPRRRSASKGNRVVAVALVLGALAAVGLGAAMMLRPSDDEPARSGDARAKVAAKVAAKAGGSEAAKVADARAPERAATTSPERAAEATPGVRADDAALEHGDDGESGDVAQAADEPAEPEVDDAATAAVSERKLTRAERRELRRKEVELARREERDRRRREEIESRRKSAEETLAEQRQIATAAAQRADAEKARQAEQAAARARQADQAAAAAKAKAADDSAARPAPAAATLDARTSISGLNVSGSLQSSVVKRALDRVVGSFRGCYKSAATRAGRNAGGTVKVSFTIDEVGKAGGASAKGGPLPGMDSCIRAAVSRVKTRTPPDVGRVGVGFTITYAPM